MEVLNSIHPGLGKFVKHLDKEFCTKKSKESFWNWVNDIKESKNVKLEQVKREWEKNYWMGTEEGDIERIKKLKMINWVLYPMTDKRIEIIQEELKNEMKKPILPMRCPYFSSYLVWAEVHYSLDIDKMNDEILKKWVKKIIGEKFKEISPGSGYWENVLQKIKQDEYSSEEEEEEESEDESEEEEEEESEEEDESDEEEEESEDEEEG